MDHSFSDIPFVVAERAILEIPNYFTIISLYWNIDWELNYIDRNLLLYSLSDDLLIQLSLDNRCSLCIPIEIVHGLIRRRA